MTLPALTAALLLAGAPAPLQNLPPQAAMVSEIAIAAAIATPAPPATAPSAPAPAGIAAPQFAADAPVPAPPPGPDVAPDDAGQDEITVTARHHDAGDPLEAVNIKSFQVTQAVDRALIRPVAKTYQRILPDPVRSGFRNVLNNLREPVAFINFLLQFKPGKAVETAARFAINSTVGAAGLFDIAKRKPFHLPRRINGFAYTLGYYGVKSGAFLYLPLIGPTTVRDFIGDGIDRLFLPVVVGKPFRRPVYAIAVGAFSSLDQRAQFDEKLEELHHGSDPYADTRADYLRHRQEIIDGLHNRHPAPIVPTDAALAPSPTIATPGPSPHLDPVTPEFTR